MDRIIKWHTLKNKNSVTVHVVTISVMDQPYPSLPWAVTVHVVTIGVMDQPYPYLPWAVTVPTTPYLSVFFSIPVAILFAQMLVVISIW